MSIASSIPCIKLKISHSSSYHSSNLKSTNPSFMARSSKAEGPLRRPSAPPLSPPTKPITPSQPQPQSHSTKAEFVSLEYQRKMAKEMQDYFKQKKLEEADQGPFFGFTGKNEIANGSQERGPAPGDDSSNQDVGKSIQLDKAVRPLVLL